MIYWTKFFLSEVPKNLKSGITVSLVNVPLSISLAIAGGAGPVAGIVTAFWCGAFAAIFGGSEYNIVGPTGALSGILAAASSHYNPSILPWLSIWAGIFSLVVWMFNLIDYLLFIPSSVVHGFTLGVAVIIALNQLDSAVGLEMHHTSTDEFYEKFYHSLCNLNTLSSPASFLFFAINLSTIYYLFKKYPRLPWPIAFTVVGAVVGYFGSIKDVWPANQLITLGEHFHGVKLSLELFNIPQWSNEVFSYPILATSAAVSFIGILETLISARMADEMTDTDHDRKRELLGLGIANIIGGMFGGIPATAALARTSLNVQSGATSRMSAILNSFALLVIAFFLLPYFSYVPMSTIAAILVLISIRMVDYKHLHHLFHYEKHHFGISMITALICIFVDTMMGLVAGAILSLLMYANRIAMAHVEIVIYSGINYHKETGASGRPAEERSIAQVDVSVLDHITIPSRIRTLFTMYHNTSRAGGVSSPTTSTVVNERTYISISKSDEAVDSLAINGSTPQPPPVRRGSHEYETGIAFQTPGATPTPTSIEISTTPASDINGNRLPIIREVPMGGGYQSASSSGICYFHPSLGVEYTLFYRIAGQLSYINAGGHIMRTKKLVTRLQGIDCVVISLRTVWTLDLDGVDALDSICSIYDTCNVKCILEGVSRIRGFLSGHAFFRKIVEEGRCLEMY